MNKAFQKGISFSSWEQGQYATDLSDQSLHNLASTGATWVALIVTSYQQNFRSKDIKLSTPKTASDDDLLHAIHTAQKLGLQVMLKPHIDLQNDPLHWRGNIGDAFTTKVDWYTWFTSYTNFITHYAQLAKKAEVEQLCIGTELVGTSAQEKRWRAVISEVKKIFHKSLVYASNHGEEKNIIWWDALDFIGVDAYYGLTKKDTPSLSEIKNAWIENRYISHLESLANTYNKQIIFTEIGYKSTVGTNKEPWNWQQSSQISFDEQANCYQAVMEIFLKKTWMAGLYWWNWDPNPKKGGTEDNDYTPFMKPAEKVLTTFYSSASPDNS